MANRRKQMNWSDFFYPTVSGAVLANVEASQTIPDSFSGTLRRIDEYKLREGITSDKEMAHRCGLHPKSFQRLRVGAQLGEASLRKIATVLGLSVEELRKP